MPSAVAPYSRAISRSPKPPSWSTLANMITIPTKSRPVISVLPTTSSTNDAG